MPKKTALWSVLILGSILWGETGIARAQETSPSKGGAQTETAADAKQKSSAQEPLEAYHLDFAINEFEDGKKINSRQYAMNLSTNDSNEIKIGTKIPVATKENEFQYLDVGTNVWAQLREQIGRAHV